MLDPYNRDINYLRISVTDRCNLRCTYCRPMEGISLTGHEDILRYEEILRVVSRAVALGFVKVRLTGGEPLVRRGFVEFAAELKKLKGLEDISLTTNGILLEKYADAIFKAGITRINISLDSLDRDKYRQITRGGNLDDVFNGIAAVEKAGFSPIKINTVIVKGFNDNEVMDFARLAMGKPFQIRFIEIMPVSSVNTGHAEDFLPNRELMETIGRHFRLAPLAGKKHKSDGPARIYTLQDGRGEIGFIDPVSDHFCATCNRLRLMADGKLRACLLMDDLIGRAVRLKPEKHDLDCTDRHLKKCHRDMSDIGG